ncbi:PilN domain-containing protein [Erwinia sp. Leaf53]|uniref:PilN domain-containing protein n=1 Tax=Erwinia sp. Leaf53 TaxID=1736225 RepID=UPI0006FCFB22|nr:PilN domain-containing protein [Erwinia sp. Leaf53]KQN64001.1 hypothetical protein ASF13_17225 [Erwinia sp. Leaf53]
MVPVNLLPWRTQRLRRQWRRWCLLLLVALPLLSALPGLWLQWQHQLNRQQKALLATCVEAQRLAAALQARTQAVLQPLNALQLQRLQQQQRLQRLLLWRDVAERIAQVIPAGVWLSELKTGTAGVQLQGASRGVAGVHRFRDRLGQLSWVQQVTSGSVVRNAEDEVHFSLQVHLRQPAPP